ncbi:molybdate ABC transporter substrate-binding protein [Vibrio sp.]|uniref:molybdate ABC transporter substrate-binding protein n=1 Tax=Vibrio sp. TaxID=678 RepID=UPI003D0A36A2
MKVPKVIVTVVCLLTSLTMQAAELRIYAASSMTNVIDDIKPIFAKRDITIKPVYGSSSSLARQVAAGAPADVFVSASSDWVDYLVKNQSIRSDNVTTVANNRLVAIAPVTAPFESFDYHDQATWITLLADSRLAIGQPDSVPAGIYAKQTLQNLKLWASLQHHLAPTNNVRVALALVERGESPLGIVYNSDAIQSAKVKIVSEFDNSLHTPIVYPMAIINESPYTEALKQYFISSEGKALLKKHGFE